MGRRNRRSGTGTDDLNCTKIIPHFLTILVFAALVGGWASHTGISTPHHHIGVGCHGEVSARFANALRMHPLLSDEKRVDSCCFFL